ncbi:MAG: hypothetical protein AB9907_18420 [Flexilinea sp.]
MSFHERTSSFRKTFVKWKKSLRFELAIFCPRPGVNGRKDGIHQSKKDYWFSEIVTFSNLVTNYETPLQQ